MTTNIQQRTEFTLVKSDQEPSHEELFAAAKQQGGEMSDAMVEEMLKIPDIVSNIKALIAKNKLKQAKREEAEKRKVIADAAQALRNKLDAELNPEKPKSAVQLVPFGELAKSVPPREPTLVERVNAMKQKYGTKFPSWVFDTQSPSRTIALLKNMVAVQTNFVRDMRKSTGTPHGHATLNKVRAIGRAIENLGDIIRNGYRADPKGYVSGDLYLEVKNSLKSEPLLWEHCKPLETKEQRELREKQEAELKQQAAEAEAKKLAEREHQISDTIAKMMTDDYIQTLRSDEVRAIAKRVVKVFGGNLKKAAREKCGSEVSDEGRKLGRALARADGLTEAEVNEMFPARKQKKDKQTKHR